MSTVDLASMNFSYLASTVAGDGEIYYRSKSDENVENKVPLVLVMKRNNDVDMGTLFPNQSPVGLPPTFRFFVERGNLDCAASRLDPIKLEYYNAENTLRYMLWAEDLPPISIVQGSPFAVLKRAVCPPAP